MVQEFHVLRCFSCKTFQVQQVKKSKKWSCKICGEKQSLIKEYGRGTGADCRRHVQKLNLLRGELHEVENQRISAQWEKEEEEEEEEECELKVSPGDETRNWQQKTETPVVSRWSKYVDQREIGSDSKEDERKEKARVSTDTEQRRRHNNISRKRKKSFTSRATYRRSSAEEDQDKDTAHEEAARPSKPRRHDAPFDFKSYVLQNIQPPFYAPRTDALSASPAVSEGIRKYTSDTGSQFAAEPLHSVSLHGFSAPSFSHQQPPSETKPLAKDSKWARFLTSVCDADEDEEDGAEQTPCLDEDQTASVQSPVMPVAKVLPNDTGSTSSGQSNGAGNVYKPVVSFSMLFRTDEDFDDAY